MKSIAEWCLIAAVILSVAALFLLGLPAHQRRDVKKTDDTLKTDFFEKICEQCDVKEEDRKNENLALQSIKNKIEDWKRMNLAYNKMRKKLRLIKLPEDSSEISPVKNENPVAAEQLETGKDSKVDAKSENRTKLIPVTGVKIGTDEVKVYPSKVNVYYKIVDGKKYVFWGDQNKAITFYIAKECLSFESGVAKTKGTKVRIRTSKSTDNDNNIFMEITKKGTVVDIEKSDDSEWVQVRIPGGDIKFLDEVKK